MGWMFDHSDAFSIQMEEENLYRAQQEYFLKEGLSLITEEMVETFVNFVVAAKFIEGKTIFEVAEMAGLPLKLEKEGREFKLPWDKVSLPADSAFKTWKAPVLVKEGRNWWRRDITAQEFYELRPDLRPEGEVFPISERLRMRDRERRETSVEGNILKIREYAARLPFQELPFFGYGPEELIREVCLDVNIVDEDDYKKAADKLMEAGFIRDRLEDLVQIPSEQERRAAQLKKDQAAADAVKAEVEKNGFAYIDVMKFGVCDLFRKDPEYSIVANSNGKRCWVVYRKDADPKMAAKAAGLENEIGSMVSLPAGQSLKLSKSENGIEVKFEVIEDLELKLSKPWGKRRVAETTISRENILAETNRVNTDRYTLDGLSQVWHFRSFETALENCLIAAIREAGIRDSSEGVRKALPQLRSITGRSFTRNGNWINGEDWMRKQLTDLSALARLAGIKCRNVDAVMNAYRR